MALESGADAVHPGYGFLAENADFARAVTRAGLTWIGPPPEAIEALGDKVRARHIARQAGAPLTPGTQDPVRDAEEIRAFGAQYGYPIAIKAAFGGGGRGLKVAWGEEEVAGQYESAVREATAAFGRGECFVERYLDRPRHVETQCLADAHGNVVVISTRDCSLQRRHQKLVEEAPAPFLSSEQVEALYEARPRRSCGWLATWARGRVSSWSAGTATISFLEVNTRLQVEHPVSEEVTGIDLVREMFRIADGEPLGYDDPPARGHSIEFRINAEDPAHRLPARLPGTITRVPPAVRPGRAARFGVRGRDDGAAGVRLADRQAHRDRRQPGRGAAAGGPRARRVRGRRHADRAALPPRGRHRPGVHRAGRLAADPHPLDRDRFHRADARPGTRGDGRGGRPGGHHRGGGRETTVGRGAPPRSSQARRVSPGPLSAERVRGTRSRHKHRTGSGDTLVSPMQGTIVEIAVADGERVAAGDVIVVLEAMKMEQPLAAHKGGTVTGLAVAVGQTVTAGAPICELKD